MKSTLKKVFPGRFTKTSPAAVELHVSMELLSEGVETVTLTPDKESELQSRPQHDERRGPRGSGSFFIKAYPGSILAHGGHFIVKAKGIINPIIRSALFP